MFLHPKSKAGKESKSLQIITETFFLVLVSHSKIQFQMQRRCVFSESIKQPEIYIYMYFFLIQFTSDAHSFTDDNL